MSIVTEWEIKTRGLMPRSVEIKKVDSAVKEWATKGQGPRDANMQNLWTVFSAWKTAKAPEYNRIKAQADELEGELALKWSAKPQIAGVVASQVKPVGWKLVAYNPRTHGGSMLPAAQHAPALTPAEITKVNEAIRRVRMGVEAARNAMLTVAKRQMFKSPMPAEEQTYTDFFGPYDATRLNRIVTNFQVLVLAFINTPDFIDVRNRTQWSTTYGGCVRRNLAAKNKGVLSLAGTVAMLVGRAFLGTGSYQKTTDDTIATLVHEFAHGALNAVDVPDVDAMGNFLCTRQSDDPNNADFGNSTDPFGHQCGTEAMDKVLARFKPEYAIVNADSYGQFTKNLLIYKSG